MATAKKLDAGKLTLPAKKEIIKTEPVNIEVAVKKIHEPEAVKEKTVRITYDVSQSRYNAIRRKMIDMDMKFIYQCLDKAVDDYLSQ